MTDPSVQDRPRPGLHRGEWQEVIEVICAARSWPCPRARDSRRGETGARVLVLCVFTAPFPLACQQKEVPRACGAAVH